LELAELALPEHSARLAQAAARGQAGDLAQKILAHLARDGDLPIEIALRWACEIGLSAAEFFDEIEAMKTRRLLAVTPDLLTPLLKNPPRD
jgi:thioesterase domain-containing protein